MLSFAFDKAKLFAEICYKDLNLDVSGISLTVFLLNANLELHIIPITPKLVKKVIVDLDFSKVVLKNCEPEFSYISADLFNKCFKESWFSDCWKVTSVVPIFKNVGERATARNYRHVSLLSTVSKVFKKLGTRIFFTNQVLSNLRSGFWPFLSLLDNSQFWVVLDWTFSQKYPYNANVSYGSNFGPTFFPLYINDLPCDVIFIIAIFFDDSTFYCKCDQTSDLRQQIEVTLNLNLKLGTVDWRQEVACCFQCWKKLILFHFTV